MIHFLNLRLGNRLDKILTLKWFFITKMNLNLFIHLSTNILAILIENHLGIEEIIPKQTLDNLSNVEELIQIIKAEITI